MADLLKQFDPRLRAILEDDSQDFTSVDIQGIAPKQVHDSTPVQVSALMLAGTGFEKDKLEELGIALVPLTATIWSIRGSVGQLRQARDENLVDDIEYLEIASPVSPMLGTSVAKIKARPQDIAQFGNIDGTDVVVGIVDYGIDWTLPDFCDSSGNKTRIKFLWDHALTAKEDEKPPDVFNHGVEYDDRKINTALELWRNGNRAGAKKMIRHRPVNRQAPTDVDGHGTHVAGIAAGNGSSVPSTSQKCPDRAGKIKGVAPNAWLVFVSLNRPAITDPVGSASGTLANSADLAEAIVYCYQKADELTKKLKRPVPCVVNLSMGFNGGSHDGESLVERVIDSMIELRGRALVVAAGNQRDQRTYYTGTVQAGAPAKFDWHMGSVTGPDPTPNELEIWYSSRDTFAVTITDTDPHGQTIGPIRPGKPYKAKTRDQVNVLIDSEKFTALNGDARIYIRLSLDKLAGLYSGQPPETETTWTIELTCQHPQVGIFDAWIEKEAGIGVRDPRDPRQSTIKTPLDTGRRITTITTPATARRAIAVGAVGGVRVGPHRLYGGSGSGPTRDGRLKPEIVAPGVGIRSNDVIFDRPQACECTQRVMKGTSMAAPHVTGVVALMLQLNPKLTSDQIRKILIVSAERKNHHEDYTPVWGYGVVDALKALKIVNQLLTS